LEGLVFKKGLLHGVEFAVVRETLDSRDLFVLDVAREREAGADGLAVDENRTRAAEPTLQPSTVPLSLRSSRKNSKSVRLAPT
jgi:hypothetical protein